MIYNLKNNCRWCSHYETCTMKKAYEQFQDSILTAGVEGDEHFKVNIYCEKWHLDKVTFVKPMQHTHEHHCTDDACSL